MPSRYTISTGRFENPQGELVGLCYTGHPPYVDHVDAIKLKDRGPLPPGPYLMATPINTEMDQSKWPAPTAHLGPLAIPLVPLPVSGSFEWLYGRSGFYIHGDAINHPGFGSEGCIVTTCLPDGVEDGRAVRMAIAAVAKVDNFLNVVLEPLPEDAKDTAETPTPEAKSKS